MPADPYEVAVLRQEANELAVRIIDYLERAVPSDQSPESIPLALVYALNALIAVAHPIDRAKIKTVAMRLLDSGQMGR